MNYQPQRPAPPPQQYSQGSIPQQHGYDRPPPQLPPKQSYSSSGYYSSSQQQQQPIIPQRQPEGNNSSWQPQQQNKPSNESNLIYDNPSTYNPNMYNFFSNK